MDTQATTGVHEDGGCPHSQPFFKFDQLHPEQDIIWFIMEALIQKENGLSQIISVFAQMIADYRSCSQVVRRLSQFSAEKCA